MKRLSIFLALFCLGLLAASLAVAKPPPGHGNGNQGKGKKKGATTSSVSSPTTTTTEKKVWLCHKTGSATNPWRKIHVSMNAKAAHMAHGDQLSSATGTCSGAGGGTTSSTTTTP